MLSKVKAARAFPPFPIHKFLSPYTPAHAGMAGTGNEDEVFCPGCFRKWNYRSMWMHQHNKSTGLCVDCEHLEGVIEEVALRALYFFRQGKNNSAEYTSQSNGELKGLPGVIADVTAYVYDHFKWKRQRMTACVLEAFRERLWFPEE